MADKYLPDTDLQKKFEFVLNLIRTTHTNVYKLVNLETIDLYWNIGE